MSLCKSAVTVPKFVCSSSLPSIHELSVELHLFDGHDGLYGHYEGWMQVSNIEFRL